MSVSSTPVSTPPQHVRPQSHDATVPSDYAVSERSVDEKVDLELGGVPPLPEDGNSLLTFYFFSAFFTAALILPFVFLFLCCPQSCGLTGKRRKAFVWGAVVGMVAAIGVVALHFFIGYGIFLAWWMSKYDYI